MQTTIPPGFKVTEEQFIKLAAERDNRLELAADGELIVRSFNSGITGIKLAQLSGQIANWNQQTKLGVGFASGAGFKLSNGAIRSPNVTWIERSRWDNLTELERQGFAPIDPDLVIELMSASDSLRELQAKMQEYINCGVKLGWLINPDAKQVEIYKADGTKEVLDNPEVLSGGDLLPGLKVALRKILN